MFKVYVRNKSSRSWYGMNSLGLPTLPIHAHGFSDRAEAVKAVFGYIADATSPLQVTFDPKRNLYENEITIRIEKEL